MLPLVGSRRAARLVERNIYVYRRTWLVIFTGFFEPLFYLLTVRVGIEQLVGDVAGPGGRVIDYGVFVAPALLAASAMNGAWADATFNVFFKLKFAKTYDAVLATPVGVGDVALGELGWAMIRGAIYAAAFVATMVILGVAHSAWVVLAFPAALLVSVAFAGAGLATTTFMRTWQDFDLVGLAILPMFLLSATFYPLSTYPGPWQVLVQLTPLYHGVDLIRSVSLGVFEPSLLVHVGYLVAMGWVGLSIAARRLGRLLLH